MVRKLRFSEMSLEELLVEMHRMELTREDDFNVNDVGYGREIELHKHILCELRKPKNSESKDIRASVERKLSKLLYNHGSEMKFRGQGRIVDAEKALEQAFCLDCKNGMAAYRLAFIHYRMNHYQDAIRYFNTALENISHDEPIFCLSEREIYYARVHLLDCYLHEVDNLNYKLDDPAIRIKYPGLPNYDPYSVKDFIKIMGLGLTDQEYEVIDNQGNRYVSYGEAEDYFEKVVVLKTLWLFGLMVSTVR